MKRTDAPDNVAGQFQEPDEQTATLGTEIAAEWLTDVEENIVRTEEEAGLTPVEGSNDSPEGFNQLPQAIKILAGRAVATSKNLLINGGFDLWRRSDVDPPSFVLSAGVSRYTADRWHCNAGAGGTATFSRIDLGAGLGRKSRAGRNALQWSQSVLGTSPRIEQRVELLEELDDQKITLSFDVLSGAGSKSVIPYCRQSFGVGGDADVEVLTTAVTAVATGWTRFTVTFDMSSVAGKTVGPGAYTAFGFEGPSGITFGLAFAAVQVEFGDTETEYALEDLATVLAKSMRYFQTSYELGTPVGTVTETGALSADEGGISLEGLNIVLPVPMRVAPAVALISPRSGTIGSIERPNGSDSVVTALLFTSRQTLGIPVTGATSVGAARAHYALDAEL